MKPKHGLKQLKWVKMGPNQPKQNIKQPISWEFSSGCFTDGLGYFRFCLGCFGLFLVGFQPTCAAFAIKHYQ
jgi:hypothetical protein